MPRYTPVRHTFRRNCIQTIDLSGQALSATLDYPIVCRLIAGNPRLARLRLSRAGLCGVTSGGRGRRSLVGLHSLALTLKVRKSHGEEMLSADRLSRMLEVCVLYLLL